MQNRFLPWLFLLSLISTCAEVDISVPGFPQIAQFLMFLKALFKQRLPIIFRLFSWGFTLRSFVG